MASTGTPRAGTLRRGFPLRHCPGNWRGRQQREAMGKRDRPAIGVSAMPGASAQCRVHPHAPIVAAVGDGGLVCIAEAIGLTIVW